MTAQISLTQHDASKLPRLAADLWRIANGYGFHPAKDGRFENEAARADFAHRLDDFISHHLVLKPEAPCTSRTLRHFMEMERRPVQRKEALELKKINELTLAWAACLLLKGYRGLTRGEALNTLKVLAIQLLEKFGYPLQPYRAMFCPILNAWENEKDWAVILSNDTGVIQETPCSSTLVVLPDVCKQCVEEHTTVR
ncbi:MAG: hypothetical protein JWN89_390 [Parcubacteria group bacterium]|nr:hypothetical protein [Parcubacteria group bacterium]